MQKIKFDPYYSTKFFNHNTGNITAPDRVSFFVKSNGVLKIYHKEAPANTLGKYVPIIGSYIGIIGVVKCVKKIFENLRNGKSNLNDSNLYKSLGRRCVEVLPLTGIFLAVYDRFKDYLIHDTIEKKLESSNDVVGCALDGVIINQIATTSISSGLQPLINKGDKEGRILYTIDKLWKKVINHKDYKNLSLPETIKKSFEKIQTEI